MQTIFRLQDQSARGILTIMKKKLLQLQNSTHLIISNPNAMSFDFQSSVINVITETSQKIRAVCNTIGAKIWLGCWLITLKLELDCCIIDTKPRVSITLTP
jgi:hypothetical protein